MSLARERRKVKPKYPDTEEGKRRRQEDFEYCMGYLAQTGYYKNHKETRDMRPRLTLLDLKILETGLYEYKKTLQKYIEEDSKHVGNNVFEREEIRCHKEEQEECDKILQKLRAVQEPIFKKITAFDISYMYAHKILGIGHWTSGGTIQ